jgi:hypothetical protein
MRIGTGSLSTGAGAPASQAATPPKPDRNVVAAIRKMIDLRFIIGPPIIVRYWLIFLGMHSLSHVIEAGNMGQYPTVSKKRPP